MSEREDFEAQVLSKYPNQDMGRFSDGEYQSVMVQHCWEFWQARAARTAPAEQAEPVAEMKGSYLYPLKSIPSGTKLYTAPDALQAEVERLRKDRKSCWEEFKALVKSSKEREGELKAENERLREEVERLKEELEENNSYPAVAAIEYALRHSLDEPMEFLRCWMGGDFDSLREEWNDVPDEVFIGADPLFKRTANPEVKS